MGKKKNKRRVWSDVHPGSPSTASTFRYAICSTQSLHHFPYLLNIPSFTRMFTINRVPELLQKVRTMRFTGKNCKVSNHKAKLNAATILGETYYSNSEIPNINRTYLYSIYYPKKKFLTCRCQNMHIFHCSSMELLFYDY